MQMSKRALRMERHHRRTKKGSALSLVSMMDIFTILVFFLLVSSAETEVLPNPKEIRLPESAALEKARESVVVMVTDTQILVQGRPVTTVAAALAGEPQSQSPPLPRRRSSAPKAATTRRSSASWTSTRCLRGRCLRSRSTRRRLREGWKTSRSAAKRSGSPSGRARRRRSTRTTATPPSWPST